MDEQLIKYNLTITEKNVSRPDQEAKETEIKEIEPYTVNNVEFNYNPSSSIRMDVRKQTENIELASNSAVEECIVLSQTKNTASSEEQKMLTQCQTSVNIAGEISAQNKPDHPPVSDTIVDLNRKISGSSTPEASAGHDFSVGSDSRDGVITIEYVSHSKAGELHTADGHDSKNGALPTAVVSESKEEELHVPIADISDLKDVELPIDIDVSGSNNGDICEDTILSIAGHFECVFNKLETMQKQEELCDIAIATSDGLIKAHSLVLVACSNTLHAILSSDDGQTFKSLISVPDHNKNVVSTVLKSLYSGCLAVNRDSVHNVMKLCHQWELTQAAELCQQYITKPPSPRKKQGRFKSKCRPGKRTHTDQDTSNITSKRKRGRPRKVVQPKYVDDAEVGLNQDEKNTTESADIGKEDGATEAADSLNIIADNNEGTAAGDCVDTEADDGGAETEQDLPVEASEQADSIPDMQKEGVAQSDAATSGYMTRSRKGTRKSTTSEHSHEESAEDSPNKVKWPKEYRYTCGKCFQRFPEAVERDEHRESCVVKRTTVHKVCQKCRLTFTTRESLLEHRNTYHKGEKHVRPPRKRNKRFVCEICGYRTDHRAYIYTHKKMKHQIPYEDNPDVELIYCDVAGCKYKTVHQQLLKVHKENKHTMERKFFCEKCSQSFKTKGVLRTHTRTVHEHSTDQLHMCTDCGKVMKTQLGLKAHQKRHHTPLEKMKYQCSDCDYVNNDKADYHTHRYLKHAEKPPEDVTVYICQYCPYASAHKNDFQVHMRRHRGEKPFQCSYCGKRFPCKGQLHQHERWHYDKNQKCEYPNCGFTCTLPHALEFHIRTVHTHRNDKPWVCHICDYRTNVKHNLNLHLRKTHKLTVQNNMKKLSKVEDPTNNASQKDDSAAQYANSGEHPQILELPNNTVISYVPALSSSQDDLPYDMRVLHPHQVDILAKQADDKVVIARGTVDVAQVLPSLDTDQQETGSQSNPTQFTVARPIDLEQVIQGSTYKPVTVGESVISIAPSSGVGSIYFENYFQVQDTGTTSLLTELIKDSLHHVQQ